MFTDFVWANKEGQHDWWRVLSSLGASIAILVLVAFVGQVFVLKPLIEALGEQTVFIMLSVAVYMSVLFGTAIGCLALMTKWLHKRSARSLIEGKQRFSLGDMLFAFVLYSLLMLGGVFLLDPANFVAKVTAKSGFDLAVTALPLAIGFIIQGGGEEVLLRGYVPQVLNRWLKRPMLAMAIPGVIFALLHAGYGLQGFLSSALFAIFAIIIVLRSDNLALITGAHAANNFMILWLLSDLGAATKPSGWSVDVADLAMMVGVYVTFTLVATAWTRIRKQSFTAMSQQEILQPSM